MLGLFGFLYAVLTLIAGVSFVWGIGSAMMNGARASSMGPCLAVAMVSGGLAMVCFEIIK